MRMSITDFEAAIKNLDIGRSPTAKGLGGVHQNSNLFELEEASPPKYLPPAEIYCLLGTPTCPLIGLQ